MLIPAYCGWFWVVPNFTKILRTLKARQKLETLKKVMACKVLKEMKARKASKKRRSRQMQRCEGTHARKHVRT